MLIALVVSIVFNLLISYMAYYILKVLNEMWAIKYDKLTIQYVQLVADSKELVNVSNVLVDRIKVLSSLQDAGTNEDDDIAPVIKPTKDQLN